MQCASLRRGRPNRRRRFLPIPAILLFVFVDLRQWTRSSVVTVSALATTNEALLSRIQTAQCALQVSVGRIPGTAMPEDWAASGAKLGFELEVEFCEESCSSYEMTKERLLLGSVAVTKQGTRGKATTAIKAVEPLNEPSFVSTKGLEKIVVTEGAYGCDLLNLQSQQYSFRFFLDFPEGAKRNDVELPAERIYFLTSCWITDEVALERAKKRYRELREQLKGIQNEIEVISSKKGIIGTVLGIREMTVCIDKKQAVENQLAALEQAYPLQQPEMGKQQKLLEGPKGILFVKDGVIAVKRYRGAMETREQYHWVGTFSFSEFFEDLDDEDDDP